ncbi:MAG TPA: dihydroorotase [Chloroflexi bacterium]|nr:dihydroorotase [Chloroflexota bacterium]HHW85005.1 D-aminoacylase [Chloroflexota bacterium]
MPTYDTLIINGKLVDGSGNPWSYGDLAIRGDRIATVTTPGAIARTDAVQIIDAAGMVVCPGFIDIQSHSILPLMMDGRSLSKITQGVTTEIMGEGWTPAPMRGRNTNPMDHAIFPYPLEVWGERAKSWTRFRHWLEAMIEQGVSTNIGSFLGGGTLRMVGKGMAMGKATAEELDLMRTVMAEAMEDGALGVAYALIYPPDAYVDTDELVEICKVVAAYRGIYITHIRSEAELLVEAMQEAVEIGRRANVAVEVYHLKAAGKPNWPLMTSAIAVIEAARAEGIDITADMYPYAASGTGLTAVIPPWAQADDKLFEYLRDPAMRTKIKQEMLQPSGDWEAMGSRDPASVMPIGFQKPENKQYVGKRITEIAAMRGQDWIDATFDLLLSEEDRISTIYFSMSEENVRRQLTLPWIKISTDAGGHDPAWSAAYGPVHPRGYGTYPRVLGKYVRDEKVLPLEDAIRKMTWSVAARLGLRERGLLQTGHFADVVIFDPVTIRDCATFEDSHQLSIGVRDVWVNGVQVLADGAHTNAKPGRIVDGPGRKT